jgi:predicted NAD/FAD-binding protein
MLLQCEFDVLGLFKIKGDVTNPCRLTVGIVTDQIRIEYVSYPTTTILNHTRSWLYPRVKIYTRARTRRVSDTNGYIYQKA